MHLPNPHLMGTAGIYLERLWMAWGRGAETLGAVWEGMPGMPAHPRCGAFGRASATQPGATTLPCSHSSFPQCPAGTMCLLESCAYQEGPQVMQIPEFQTQKGHFSPVGAGTHGGMLGCSRGNSRQLGRPSPVTPSPCTCSSSATL